MRCGAWVVTRANKKGERRVMLYSPHVVDLAAVLRWNEEHADSNLSQPYQRKIQEEAKGAVRCDGDIVAAVAAVDEPEWGGSSAKFTVSYRCTACDCTCYPHLPSQPEEVSAVLTAAIAAMDGDAKRAEHAERDRKRREESERFLADMRARQAQRKS